MMHLLFFLYIAVFKVFAATLLLLAFKALFAIVDVTILDHVG